MPESEIPKISSDMEDGDNAPSPSAEAHVIPPEVEESIKKLMEEGGLKLCYLSLPAPQESGPIHRQGKCWRKLKSRTRS